MNKFMVFAAVFYAAAGTATLAADDADTNLLDFEHTDFSDPRIYLGVGADNIRSRDDFDPSVYGMIELSTGVLHKGTGLRLRVSADASEVGYWVGVGFSMEYHFETNPFYVEASLLGGWYTDDGDLDLDHDLEFRSQVMAGYIFDNGYDVAVGIAHKSNAGIGDDNPGSETVYIRLGYGI
ncbi:MAG: acyloxyacyl hydrolase [Rhizobiaceae bacterium]